MHEIRVKNYYYIQIRCKLNQSHKTRARAHSWYETTRVSFCSNLQTYLCRFSNQQLEKTLVTLLYIVELDTLNSDLIHEVKATTGEPSTTHGSVTKYKAKIKFSIQNIGKQVAVWP